MSETPNIGLYLEDDASTRFEEWRKKMNGTDDSNMKKIDDAVGMMALKSGKATGTLLASAWSGIDSPFTQTLAVEGLGADQNGNISVAQNATIEQRDAARMAMLSVIGQSEGQLTTVTEAMKNDIAVAQRLGITATTLEGILTVKGQGAALMPALFEAYVTNLGKYNEGELVGEYLKFPTTPEEVQALLKRIGIDGVRYEEIFITDFDGDVLGLYDHLGEYENIDELNHLACVISELDQSDLEKFEAVIDSGEYTGSVKELINLAQNLDCFEFYPGVTDDETLGRIYVEDMEAIDVPEHLLNYFDYEAYGRDIRLNEDGHYAPGGYVLNNGGSFIEHYHGREDIPDEHKVFSMPKLNIREQMAAYKEVIDRSSLEGERLHPRKEMPER